MTNRPQELPQLYERHIATLTQRFERALEECDAERALLFAGPQVFRTRDDQTVPFLADPYFLQWLPLPDAADSVIEIRPGMKPRLYFVSEADFWHAPPPMPPEFMLEHFDVTCATTADADRLLASSQLRTIAVGRPEPDATRNAQPVDSQSFIDALDFDRAVKTEYEIDCMEQASAAAAAGHRAVAAALQDGVSEFELHMAYCFAAGHGDADLPYPSIVALNEHAAVLHYQHRDRQPATPLRSLLIDAGARHHGYAADVTRTYSAHDEEFRELTARMDELQQYVCAQVAAGVDFVALNALTHELIAGVLEEFDLITCEADTALALGATTVFLPHGLGHLLGLQVHDVGGRSRDRTGARREPPSEHPFLRLTRTLSADMVITIEPGLYFIDRLIESFDRENPGILKRSTVARLAPFGGIRIEDNVRVKSRGHDNLTRVAFGEHNR